MIYAKKTSLDEYTVGNQIGHGPFSQFRIGLYKPTNKKVTLKIFKKHKLEDANLSKSVQREIKLMQKMKHERIVQLYEVIDTPKYVLLSLEYAGGGSLGDYIKAQPKTRLLEREAKRLFKQVIEGICYCHSRYICHRDINLENLVLDKDNNIKILNFGYSTCIPNEKKIKLFNGAPFNKAPEVVMKQEHCGPPVDIWAMGVLLFTMLTGKYPYRGASDCELYDNICKANYQLSDDVNDSLSAHVKDLLALMFATNPDDRPSAR